MLALLLASSLSMLANTVIAPALPKIAEAFTSTDPLGVHTRLLLTAPALVTIFAAPLAGYLGDRWKRTPVLIVGMLLFALFGTAGLWINDLDLLLVSRLLLGIPVGMMLSQSSSLFGDYYSGPQRARAMGLQGMSNSLGGMFFIAAGGALSGFSWRYPFAVYGLGVIFAVIAYKALPEPKRNQSHQTHLGAVVITPWFKVTLIYLTALIGISAFFLIPVNIAFLLQERLGLQGYKVGLVMASSTGIAALVAMRYAKIRGKLGGTGTFAITFVFMSFAMWVLSWAHSIPWFMLGMLFNGLGLGLMFPNTSGSVLELVNEKVRGRAIGLLSSFFFLGQFLSPVLTALLVTRVGGVSGVFLVASGILFTMALIYLVAIFRIRAAKS